MQQAGLSAAAIAAFASHFRLLCGGATGFIPEEDIKPVASLPSLDALPGELEQAGRDALAQTAVLKLNGGLGTNMGLDLPKSLLPVRENLTFLDVLIRQSESVGTPLVLMNSFATHRATAQAIREKYGDLGEQVLMFEQHKVPKVSADDFLPADWPEAPELEWCPPGHGNLYLAIAESGTLAALRARGIRWIFVSNSDNLGAVLDLKILGYLAQHGLPFLMEVTRRTEADKKGGHLAVRSADERLVLREAAQCAPEDERTFQDYDRHRYFNTNNLWIELAAIEELLAAHQSNIPLPLIRNRKPIDPTQPGTPQVFQLETAMGAVIELLSGAGAMEVPRHRFAPVKTCADLLLIGSDAYQLTDDYRIVLAASRQAAPLVKLDKRFYHVYQDFCARFPHGPPSLLPCNRLAVEGDIRFGKDIVCRGKVSLQNASDTQVEIEDGTELTGQRQWP